MSVAPPAVYADTVVALVHAVVANETSDRATVGVVWYKPPKFSPEMVTDVPSVTGVLPPPPTMFEVTGTSNEKSFLLVPTTAPTVIRTVPGSELAAALPRATNEFEPHMIPVADDQAVVAQISSSRMAVGLNA